VSARPPTTARPRRTPLGGERGLLSNVSVYRTAEALEVDELEGYDVTRRSVLLDEVLVVTYHRTLGWRLLAGSAVAVTVVGVVSALVAIQSPAAAAVTFALFGLPFLVAAALRLALRKDVVTVYGVRGKTKMAFWFRKQRAREVFALVCRLARERQGRPAVRRPAREQPAPVPAVTAAS
jgi:hypothetical protein